MGILIRITPIRSAGGVTEHNVVLASGTVIGTVAQAVSGAFVARTAEGHPVDLGSWCGDTTFTTVTDAAVAAWLGFMAQPTDAERPSSSRRQLHG